VLFRSRQPQNRMPHTPAPKSYAAYATPKIVCRIRQRTDNRRPDSPPLCQVAYAQAINAAQDATFKNVTFLDILNGFCKFVPKPPKPNMVASRLLVVGPAPCKGPPVFETVVSLRRLAVETPPKRKKGKPQWSITSIVRAYVSTQEEVSGPRSVSPTPSYSDCASAFAFPVRILVLFAPSHLTRLLHCTWPCAGGQDQGRRQGEVHSLRKHRHWHVGSTHLSDPA
jgi:hypothetical protein